MAKLKSNSERDKLVLDALNENIKKAPSLGICAETFYALKQEFLRIMQERDDALKQLQDQEDHEM
jgi:hypothetical protein